MKEIKPTGYDPEKRVVLLGDDGQGASEERYFIRQALLRFKRYGEPELLIWAIERGLPGLMEDKAARDILAQLVGKAARPNERNREADDKREEIFKRVWFHHGRGFPFHRSDSSMAGGETACSLTAAEVGRSVSQVYRVWKESGGKHPQGTTLITAWFWRAEGKAVITK